MTSRYWLNRAVSTSATAPASPCSSRTNGCSESERPRKMSGTSAAILKSSLGSATSLLARMGMNNPSEYTSATSTPRLLSRRAPGTGIHSSTELGRCMRYRKSPGATFEKSTGTATLIGHTVSSGAMTLTGSA